MEKSRFILNSQFLCTSLKDLRFSILNSLRERILILDGGSGTMIQGLGLTESDFRGERFADFPTLLKGNNDILSLTCPHVVRDIHRQYIEAGADIITTNTFNANALSMEDYGMQSFVSEINLAAARLARETADGFMAQYPQRTIFVAGSLGPTNKTASMSPDVQRPAYRSVSYMDMYRIFREQTEALIEGGVDILLFETAFDTLNLKAGLEAAFQVMHERHCELPVMVSLTLSGKGGRTLSGQTLSAFLASIQHVPVVSVGLNCSFGALEMKPFLHELAQIAPYYISAHPNAGFPNAFGIYEDSPEKMTEHIRSFVEEGLVNILGGCCGTTPAHIACFAELVRNVKPRQRNQWPIALWVSGLELLEVKPENNFISIGERCNVAGSRKFLRLIKEGNYEEALTIARKQVEDGAQVIDINMDDGLLDATREMTTFLNLIASEPEIARVPVMIDSSKWEVIEQGLMCVQGKSIVNSISLKEGEALFLERAKRIRQLGAAVVVMAFDEQGQADTYERKIEVCERAYRLLTEQIGFPSQDIIFDPNVLAIATGMAEHNGFGFDFIRAVSWIKQHLLGAKVSGGVSNLSFAFRGNNNVREAMHTVFLYHAIQAGMDMGIVNPSMSVTYDDIEPAFRTLLEDVILARRPEAADELIEYVQHESDGLVAHNDNPYIVTSPYPLQRGTMGDFPLQRGTVSDSSLQRGTVSDSSLQSTYPLKSGTVRTYPPSEGAGGGSKQSNLIKDAWRQLPVNERLEYALLKGIGEYLEADLQEAIPLYDSVVQIIDIPLMHGINQVGKLFGEGKMFLPQVVKTARTMKKAVEILQPYIEREKSASAAAKAGKIVFATVKGDVHDIGKNIVSIVLTCNNYEVIDLGVMVPAEKIIETVIREKPDLLCLSGLITPSLDEMIHVVKEMQKASQKIPIMVGGATTSKIHTALKIAPHYDYPVIHVTDASQNPLIASRLLNHKTKEQYIQDLNQEYARLRTMSGQPNETLVPLTEARAKRRVTNWASYTPVVPAQKGVQEISLPVEVVIPYINWTYFFSTWGIKIQDSRFNVGAKCFRPIQDSIQDKIQGFDHKNNEQEKAVEATSLYHDAQMLLQEFVKNQTKCMARYGFFEAVSDGDNIILNPNRVLNPVRVEKRVEKGNTDNKEIKIPVLRQQLSNEKDVYLSLSDFIMPVSEGRTDYIGAFVVTAGTGFDSLQEKVEKDSYRHLLLQSLSDRLAEASSEYLHQLVRKNFWGYAPNESLSIPDLFKSKYQGIRPAVGYPSLPDQRIIFSLDKLLQFKEIGVSLTENGAMKPSSTVAGLYFANPEAQYFRIGRISDEQLEDYAIRRGEPKDVIRKFLGQ